MEPATQPAQAQDREQPDPDPAAGVLPPPQPARRARHVRHVVRVPPIRVRVSGAPGRDLRRIDEAAKARPRVQRDRRRTGRRWAVQWAQRDPRDRSHPQPAAQEVAEGRTRPARRGRDPDGPGRPVACRAEREPGRDRTAENHRETAGRRDAVRGPVGDRRRERPPPPRSNISGRKGMPVRSRAPGGLPSW